MLRRLLESSVLFIHIIRWFLIAVLVGILVGVATTYFLKALDGSIALAGRWPWSFLLLPAAFSLSAFLVRRFAPDAEGHGTEKVIEAYHRRSGRIRLTVVPVKALATIVTIAVGGAAGKEGPSAQIGAGLASRLADLLKFRADDRKKIVVCGLSAGFAVVFGTPIAGAIFGVEALFVGAIVYDVLFPSFVAGIVAFGTAHWLGLAYPHQFQHFAVALEPALMVEVILAGVFFGLLALLLIEAMKLSRKAAQRVKQSPIWTAAIGGAALVILALILGREYLGLGLEQTVAVINGGEAPLIAPFAKMVFTSITLNFGGSGGTLSPVFYVGATGGHLLATLFDMDATFFAAIGMVAVLAGATNTPISASIMAVELFGPAIVPYAALASVVSFLMTGHRSVYPSQVLSFIKSPALRATTGKELQELDEKVHFHSGKADELSALIVRGSTAAIRRIRKIVRRSRLPARIQDEGDK
ncbi:MAG: chloride channel protein [Fidelibacterota bacterium]|nr:MAG: chloride channel protein [Candidatus Neomarinimicrobiota bacterium]